MDEVKIKLFCKVFNELVTDLVDLYPNDSSLKMFSVSVSGTQMILGEKQFVYQVIEYLEPYYQQILKKDESFFLNHLDISEHTEGDSFLDQEIERIKNIWSAVDTTDNTKECIWKYFTTLVKVGKSIKK